MTLLRKNIARRGDIAPELQSTLNANGMQAHLSVNEQGEYVLTALAHNTSSPTRYVISAQQAETMMNGGTNVWNKKAYQTFVSIVNKDYYIPDSWGAARNANSPVNMGLNGHRKDVGEYGYRGERPFEPFRGGRYGRFNDFLGNIFSDRRPGYHLRRIDDRPFLASSAPVVADRPDGRLKPGELKAGGYGFYRREQPTTDALGTLDIHTSPVVLERPKGKATTLKELIGNYNSILAFSGNGFQKFLAEHGIVIDKENKTLTILSDGVNKDFQYKLKDEELAILLNDKLRFQKKGNPPKVFNADAPNITERLDVINNIISADFKDRITKEQLNTRDYISIQLKPEVEQELGLGTQPVPKVQPAVDTTIVDMRNQRLAYNTGFVDKWNSIGVVDGRAIDPSRGFYLPVKDGRAVSVGEIQAYPTNDGRTSSYRMTAVINNQVVSHEISEKDYIRFLNFDDENRLKLFDKIFGEVEIKSASHGEMQDSIQSRNLQQADGVVDLKGEYSLVSDTATAAITGAMAWKDQSTGNYLINVRTDRDVGMWAFKITQAQYQQFKNGTDGERAALLPTLIPFMNENGESMRVVETRSLYSISMPGMNGNNRLLQMANEINATPRLHAEIVADPLHSSKETDEISDKTKPTIDTQPVKETVAYGDQLLNLNDLRTATRLNLLGDANVNGESLENIKMSKGWKRSGEHGRATEVGDISVERVRDAQGKVVEGKYKMSAVIDGNVVSHEITQKQFDKFLAVNDYQRMKLFDKIFNEVEMKTKPGHGFNLGAAILAAVTTGLDAVDYVMGMAAPPRPRPTIYETRVFSKEGVVSPSAVAAASYESMRSGIERNHEEAIGLGR